MVNVDSICFRRIPAQQELHFGESSKRNIHLIMNAACMDIVSYPKKKRYLEKITKELTN